MSCQSIAFDLCAVLLPSSGGFIHRETEEWVILWSLIIFHTWLDLQEVKGLRYQECYGLIPFITPQVWHNVDMFIVGLAWLNLSSIVNNCTYFMPLFQHDGAWRLYFDSLWRKLKARPFSLSQHEIKIDPFKDLPVHVIPKENKVLFS